MQFESRFPTPSVPHSQLAFASLASLSPVGGIESTIITGGAVSGIGALFFASSMQPLLGGLGTLMVILGVSLVVERLSRPLVLWALGRHVYHTLEKMGGKATADEVARIYAAGRTLSRDQLATLIEHNALAAGQGLGGSNR